MSGKGESTAPEVPAAAPAARRAPVQAQNDDENDEKMHAEEEAYFNWLPSKGTGESSSFVPTAEDVAAAAKKQLLEDAALAAQMQASEEKKDAAPREEKKQAPDDVVEAPPPKRFRHNATWTVMDVPAKPRVYMHPTSAAESIGPHQISQYQLMKWFATLVQSRIRADALEEKLKWIMAEEAMIEAEADATAAAAGRSRFAAVIAYCLASRASATVILPLCSAVVMLDAYASGVRVHSTLARCVSQVAWRSRDLDAEPATDIPSALAVRPVVLCIAWLALFPEPTHSAAMRLIAKDEALLDAKINLGEIAASVSTEVEEFDFAAHVRTPVPLGMPENVVDEKDPVYIAQQDIRLGESERRGASPYALLKSSEQLAFEAATTKRTRFDEASLVDTLAKFGFQADEARFYLAFVS